MKSPTIGNGEPANGTVGESSARTLVDVRGTRSLVSGLTGRRREGATSQFDPKRTFGAQPLDRRRYRALLIGDTLRRISVQLLQTPMREGEGRRHVHSSADNLDICAGFVLAGGLHCGVEFTERLDARREPAVAS